jgi:hemerythrin superfamily protein
MRELSASKKDEIMSETTVQASLAHDRDRLDQFLETYRQWKRVDYAKAKQAFREFKFGLQRHIISEETILFPLFEDKTGFRECGPTVVMRARHWEIGHRLQPRIHFAHRLVTQIEQIGVKRGERVVRHGSPSHRLADQATHRQGVVLMFDARTAAQGGMIKRDSANAQMLISSPKYSWSSL